MAGFFTDDFLPLARLRDDAGQVTHRARRHKQGGLTAERLGGAVLKFIERGILDENVVSDFRFRHGAAHLRRGFGYCIASEVDNSVGHNNSSVTPLATSHPLGASFRYLPS